MSLLCVCMYACRGTGISGISAAAAGAARVKLVDNDKTVTFYNLTPNAHTHTHNHKKKNHLIFFSMVFGGLKCVFQMHA